MSSANLPKLPRHKIGTLLFHSPFTNALFSPPLFSPSLFPSFISPIPLLSFPFSLQFSYSSLPSSTSMSDACQGSKGINCDCQQFIPKLSKQSRCKTCGHRLAAHSNADFNAPFTPPAPPTPPNGASNPTAKPMVSYGERILKSYGTSTAHRTARKETLTGYRPPSNEVSITKISHLQPPPTDALSPTSTRLVKEKLLDVYRLESPPRIRTLDWEKLEGLCFSPAGMRYHLFPLFPLFAAFDSNALSGIGSI